MINNLWTTRATHSDYAQGVDNSYVCHTYLINIT
jgi:hypothetical protein